MSAFQALAWSRPREEITCPGHSGPKPPRSPGAGGGPRSPPGHLLSSVPLPCSLSSGNMASRFQVASKSLLIVLQSQSVKSNCSVVTSFPLSCLRLRKREHQHSSSRAGKTQASPRRRPGRGPVCPCRAGFMLQSCPSAVLKFHDPIHVYPVHTDSRSGVSKPLAGPAPAQHRAGVREPRGPSAALGSQVSPQLVSEEQPSHTGCTRKCSGGRIRLSASFLGSQPKAQEAGTNRYLCSCVHASFIHSSYMVEATQVSVDR